MTEKTDCPNLAVCPFMKRLSLPGSAEALKFAFCRNSYQDCSRYKLKLEGNPVPEDMWPSGDRG